MSGTERFGRPQRKQTPVAANSLSMPQATARLLIADDDESIRGLLVRYFTAAGYDVQTCPDGASTVAALATGQYDVVVTDVLMPGANGLDVLRAAKAADPFTEVIFLTGAPDLTTTMKAQRDGGAFDYIVKPFPNVEVLRAVVEHAAERRTLRQENERLTQEISRSRHTDPLTGTLTRTAFFLVSEREFARAARHHDSLALIMFDLDQFQRINDQFGSAAGDAVLNRFALICREQLRAEDVLARYWADKFICLLPAADVRSAEAVADRVRTRTGAVPIPTGETAVPVRVSAGVASRQDADRSLDTLIRRAERAVRLAKDQGGDRVHTEG